MKRFSQLTQTASEADLVAGNFLAIDVPGVGGATKKMPGNCVAKRSVQDGLVEFNEKTFEGESFDDSDLSIIDAAGNVLARFKNGNFETKNFKSEKSANAEDTSVNDFSISDENKNMIVRFLKGHIQTKFFDSRKNIRVLDEPVSGLNVCDENGNIVLKVVDGNIITKNFDSSNYSLVGFDRFTKPEVNPLDKLVSTASMVRIFDTIGVVGASFDSGEIEYMDGGVKHYLDRYENSWGKRLERLNGIDVDIFAYGGQTAINWVTNSSLYNAPDGLPHTERTWAGLKASTPKKAYVIQLGGNDANNLQFYADGVGDLSTDIGTYDAETDTDTNAQSYAGYMAGIIQRIKSVQPRAKIFVCTMQRWTRNDNFGVALDNVVRGLPDYFTDVYLCDFRRYQPQKSAEMSAAYLAGGHPNEAGHVWLTDNYNTYIDWIVRKNYDKFDDVQLIGTNYTLPTN